VTNKLNKITWGLGQLETPGDTNKLKKTTKDYKTWHKTAQQFTQNKGNWQESLQPESYFFVCLF